MRPQTAAPESRMDPEQKEIDPNQGLVDIRMEIMDQIPKRLVDKHDKEDGRKGVDPIP
jgi:hypothetical protein